MNNLLLAPMQLLAGYQEIKGVSLNWPQGEIDCNPL
jgi:hypothetical protein